MPSTASYKSSGWPGAVTGTVSDSGTGGHGISAVNVSIPASVSAKCWNGSNFTTASCANLVALRSPGTTLFPYTTLFRSTLASSALSDGHTYTVSVQATDATSNGNTSGTL